MKVLEEGRIYGLRNFANDEHQEIKFTRRRYDGSFADGTTVEEVVRMLRDKFYHFNRISPSSENEKCIHMADAMLELMLKRLSDKRKMLEDVSRHRSDK